MSAVRNGVALAAEAAGVGTEGRLSSSDDDNAV